MALWPMLPSNIIPEGKDRSVPDDPLPHPLYNEKPFRIITRLDDLTVLAKQDNKVITVKIEDINYGVRS